MPGSSQIGEYLAHYRVNKITTQKAQGIDMNSSSLNLQIATKTHDMNGNFFNFRSLVKRTGYLLGLLLSFHLLATPGQVCAETVKVQHRLNSDHLQITFDWMSPVTFSATVEKSNLNLTPISDEPPNEFGPESGTSLPGHELLIRFERGAEFSEFDNLVKEIPGLIEAANAGYDTILLRTRDRSFFKVFSRDHQTVIKIKIAQKQKGDDVNVLITFAETALELNQPDVVKNMLEKYGDGFLSSRPLLGAKLMELLQDKEATINWLEKAEKLPKLNVTQQIDLLNLYAKLEIPERAQSKLDVDQLQSFIIQELNAPGIATARQQELLYALLDLGAEDQALPQLENLALTEGGDWVFFYEEALSKLKLTDKLGEFLLSRASQPNISPEEKREIAFQFLDLNFKSKAVNLFQELAKDAAPDSPDVTQLIFLLGPSVNHEDLDWLLSRTRESTGNERIEWMKHLVSAGAAQEAVDMAENIPSADPAMFETYMEALEALGDKERTRTAIRDQLSTEQNPERLTRYAKLATDLEEYEVAQTVYQKILQIKPGDDKILKELGLISYYQNKFNEAKKHLGLYISRNEGDWETNFYYAEVIYSQNGDKSEVQKYYLRALEKIASLNPPDHNAKLAEAHCLHRLERKEEAISAYEVLLAKNPEDKQVKASFVAALMETGELNRAEEILKSESLNSSK